jgi:hypothetical protein
MKTPIVVVCGFARTGSTMVMRMLHAGGIRPYAESVVSYEHRDVLRLPGDASWVANCYGKAVKLLEPHLHALPQGPAYRFVWLVRDSLEQARSFKKFGAWIGSAEIASASVQRIARSYDRDRPQVEAFLRSYQSSDVLVVRFEDVLRQPIIESNRISTFVAPLYANPRTMATRVLERGPACLPYMLEDAFVEQTEPVEPGA